MTFRNRSAKEQPKANGQAKANAKSPDSRTDYSRWRLKDDRGRQTWHYLQSDEEIKQWPQTIADKWHLGLDTGLPDLPKAKTPLQAAENGLRFFSKLQLEPGNWACEYGGPMFLLPGIIITLYVTDMPLTQPEQIEVVRYLFNMQNVGSKNGGDGGWGLHIEGDSSVFGTAMNYTCLRILGVPANEPRMVKARRCLHDMGGAVYGPHWSKFWFSVLGVMKWDIVNPVPPELWLLPDWVPIAPWRWWIHMRMVFLPMGYLWSKKWTYPRADSDPLIKELREELFTTPYHEIDFASHRNSISVKDNYHPKTWVLNLINWLLVWIWIPFLRTDALIKKAEDWVWHLIQIEGANTDQGDLAPVSAPMDTLCCYVAEGPDAESVLRHRDRLQDYFFISKDGMMADGTNGVQVWDTAFAIQAVVDAGLEQKPEYHNLLLKGLEFLEDHQFLEHVVGYEDSSVYSDPPTQATSAEVGWRHPRRGAWGFSTRSQGYVVSDCTAEAVKATMALQSTVDPKDGRTSLFPTLLSEKRLKWAVDILLTMQNSDGSCSSYEPTRGSTKMEYLNAAEVFGRIMVEYPYPECTTACVTALERFRKDYPDYRAAEIKKFVSRAVDWIRRDQAPDGSWYGSWGICFSYAGWFALESLKTQGETYENSERVRRACHFFLDRQEADGGWGESYKSCETVTWCRHPDGSQVVQTAWVVIALIEAGYPDRDPIDRAVKLIMSRQQPNGEWLQEGIEGVFNKSCMISYPNYKFIFPIKALGMYSRHFGDTALNGSV
ncbi:Seco-amyrin synthase [Cercospora beticola]|uniref:Terpene cyclase/mutase family member n=1 Tax=Cercospora beticola TaxID=122368 RepID=A0A2G5HIQ9_CERBT|nr:Seco-amyrin synthase [Cercospora beticola]PIA92428.1 Seco-amyrin synthase [Cercospora beticola]WPB05746.1 Lanosterol synthase erg7A [Cercospora beticola]